MLLKRLHKMCIIFGMLLFVEDVQRYLATEISKHRYSPCVNCVEEATVRAFSYHVVTFCFAGIVDNISDFVISVNR